MIAIFPVQYPRRKEIPRLPLFLLGQGIPSSYPIDSLVLLLILGNVLISHFHVNLFQLLFFCWGHVLYVKFFFEVWLGVFICVDKGDWILWVCGFILMVGVGEYAFFWLG